MVLMAREIAKKIESELEYPGQIKVHLLRETKAIEYAKISKENTEPLHRGEGGSFH